MSTIFREARTFQLRKKAAVSSGFCEAGDRARTGDIQLGRLALYQLSYTRVRLA
jgi:hypothetical protein